MDIFLSIVALLLLLIAGLGAALFVIPRGRAVGGIEVLGISVLLGAAFISLASFSLGFFVSMPVLRWLVSGGCVVLGGAGIWIRRRREVHVNLGLPSSVGAVFLGGIVVAQIGAVVWLAYHQTLAWDGLLVWEYKARIAFMSGGAVPTDYFSDPTRGWSHPEYPLFLPLTEAWIYAWLGRSDQGLVKMIFPLFYVSALCLLYSGGLRLGGRRSQGLAAAILLFFVPLAVLGEGSASSGYADFALAAFYLAAVIYLVDFAESSANGTLRLAATLSALLPWVKQEGLILWLCIVAFLAVKALYNRNGWILLWLPLPGVILYGSWRVFLNFVRAPQGGDFLPITPANLWTNLGRITELGHWMAAELVNWPTWGFLWPALLLALLFPGCRRPYRQHITLAAAVFLPLLLYTGLYLFSAWSPFLNHVKFSLPRLMLQTSLVAVLIVGLAIPQLKVDEKWLGTNRAYFR